MKSKTTVALLAALTTWPWMTASAAEGRNLSAMEGTWSARLSGGIETTLRLAPVEEGRISGFMCESYADGSTLAWSFGPEDEPGVVARVKFGVLEVRVRNGVNVFEIPKPGQSRIRYRARNQGDSGPFIKTRLRRTNKSTCADRLRSRADARLEPAPEREDNPLIGEWSGVWRNRVVDEIQITDIGSWGRTRGVFCEVIWNGAAFRFWDLDDRRIRARRTRDGKKTVVTWKRKRAKWALRREKSYRFEVVPSGYGTHWVVQSWRYGAEQDELTMNRGSRGARGCLARIRPGAVSGWVAGPPVETEETSR